MYEAGDDVREYIFDVASREKGTPDDYDMMEELGQLGYLKWSDTGEEFVTGGLTSKGKDYFRDRERAEKEKQKERATTIRMSMVSAVVSALLSGSISIVLGLIV